MLFSDQLGDPVRVQRSHSGVRWIRLITDVPPAALEILKGRQGWWAYLRSIYDIDVESVFSREDLLLGIAELVLFTYQVIRHD